MYTNTFLHIYKKVLRTSTVRDHCTVMIAGRCIVAVSALKIAPRRVSGDVLGILVVITPVFAHGCTGIRKWFIDGIGMWCFAMPLR